MIQAYLVRHGTTQAIENQRIQGVSDSPLSARGREEARRTAQALSPIPFNAIYSSPVGRTLETAQIISGSHAGVRIIQLENLREMNFGYYEGKQFFASPDEVPYGLRRLLLLAKVLFAQASGEYLRSVSHRAAASWEQISASSPASTLLIVSHGVLLNYLLKYLLPGEIYKSLKPASLHPCSITELMIASPGRAQLERYNDIAHLK